LSSPHGPLSENINIACIQILSRFYRCPADYMAVKVNKG